MNQKRTSATGPVETNRELPPEDAQTSKTQERTLDRGSNVADNPERAARRLGPGEIRRGPAGNDACPLWGCGGAEAEVENRNSFFRPPLPPPLPFPGGFHPAPASQGVGHMNAVQTPAKKA
jgi:hypothetical protein